MVIHVEIESLSYGQTGNSNVGYRIYDYYEVGRNAIIGGGVNRSICFRFGKQEYHLGNNYGI